MLLHFCFWSWLFIVKWYLSTVTFNVYSGFPTVELLKLNVYGTALLAAFYYLLIYGLYPYVVKTNRYGFAIMGLILLFFFYTVADGYLEITWLRNCKDCMHTMQQNNPNYYDFLQLPFSTMLFKRLFSLGMPLGVIFMLAMPISIKAGLNALRNAYAKTELIREKARLELDFLRSQINPHFLFNSLNNIYGLVLNGRADQSALLIARLSELLRYTLYEANNEWTSIAEDVRLITNYLELEKIRLNHTKVTLNLRVDDPGVKVPSLLLVPLVENAFKHVGDVPASFIHFVIRADRQQLYFLGENTVGDPSSRTPGGIGLVHLLKRLDFFYPGRYEYRVVERGNIYRVTLICKL